MPRPRDIVLVDFPFSDLSTGKLRPALVVADALDSDFLFARITSQRKSASSDVFIRDWRASGLRFPSWVQVSKLITLESRLIYSSIGRLTGPDAAAVASALRAWLDADWPPPPP